MATERKHSWRLTAAQLIVTGGALAAAAVHLMQPTAKIDGVLLGLPAVAATPWLGSFPESAEGACPGLADVSGHHSPARDGPLLRPVAAHQQPEPRTEVVTGPCPRLLAAGGGRSWG